MDASPGKEISWQDTRRGPTREDLLDALLMARGQADIMLPRSSRGVSAASLPFELDELNALLADARFEVRPKRHSFDTALSWLMLVALYGGMRQGELSELDAEDVKCERGVWFFDVTESKSEAGVRWVPVDSALIRAGFLDYVRHVGKGPLFPGVPVGGPDKRRSDFVAKNFVRHRRARGVNRPRVTFHSFRKNFVGKLAGAEIPSDSAALVVGHERGFTFKVYDREKLKAKVRLLRKVVEAMKYPGLKLPKPDRRQA